MKIPALFPLSALTLLLCSCGTIMNGTYQKVSVSSNPTGASVAVDGVDVGRAPVILELKRKDDHLVRLTMEGYQPFEMPVASSVSGWVWGNIVFGGVIGLVVDAITGGMYKLTPEQMQAQMQNASTGAVLKDGGIYVTVVLSPDPSWERIGYLQPAR